MIIREFIKDPIASISGFDFFNDYRDTRAWLREGAPEDVVALLDAAHAVWLRKWQEGLKAALK